MKENVNHANYYKKEEPVAVEAPVVEEEPIEEPVVEEIKEEDNTPLYPATEEGLKDLTQAEQVKILKDLGLSKKEIKKLKYESDRVNKILELTSEE